MGLRLRGGAEDPFEESSFVEEESIFAEDEKPKESTDPLTREQIVAKLNEVPTFTLIGEDQGGFVALKLADSEKNTICFFTDPEEAKTVLEMMKKAHTDKQIRLACVGLGTAFQLSGGWADDANSKEAFASFDGSVQLRGTLGLIESTKEQIKKMMASEGFDEAEWILPVFLVEELQGANLVPFFLDPSVIKQTWEQAGRSEEDFPDKYVMMDIRMLVQKMEAPGMPWGRCLPGLVPICSAHIYS